MSTTISPPRRESPASTKSDSKSKSKSQRVLACLFCQQRKIKCNRVFPCANCLRHRTNCVPAGLLPRERRRRFPEKELLERLRYYEGLLQQHNINFKSLHGHVHVSAAATGPVRSAEAVAHCSPSPGTLDSDFVPRSDIQPKAAIDFLRAIARVTLHGNNENLNREDNGGDYRSAPNISSKETWDTTDHPLEGDNDDPYNDYLHLFGSPKTNIDLSSFHPQQVQIFRLWQIYLDNVNPLLKVTHTPTLQPRIIDAASDLKNISPALEALMFSIYCVSVKSLVDDECQTFFGSPRKYLLTSHQYACQQALLKCKALESTDLDGFTALYLYLISVGAQTVHLRLSSILAAVMRIAKRIEIQDESTYSAYTSLEAELRRRLWWSLVTFDHRISEMSGYKTTTLDPTWDCNTPLNVNDSELRRGRTTVLPQRQPSEAIFAVVRSELADFLRHSAFHLNFINPGLNALAKPSKTRLESLENTVEEKYLQFCDLDDPLLCMTVWTARAYIARIRLIEYYSTHSTPSVIQERTDAKLDEALTYAMTMLEYDTKLITSPLTKGYAWFVDFCMPGLAYNHILNDLRRRPAMSQSRAAWDAMSDNYEARASRLKPEGGPNYVAAFSRLALKTWSAQQEVAATTSMPLPLIETPRIISSIRNRMQAQRTTLDTDQGDMVLEPGALVNLQNGGGDLGTDFFDFSGQSAMDIDMDNFLSAIDWRWLQAQG